VAATAADFGFGDFHVVEPFENFSDEKPWVPLARPREAASELEANTMGASFCAGP
jgi:hypothetical protein